MSDIGAYLTPENVTTAFRLAAIFTEYARNLARQRGMTEAEIEELYERSKISNISDLGDYIRELGGTWPPNVGEPPKPKQPPAYGIKLDECPPDSELLDNTTVYFRPEDGKWFLWRVGVFTDPTLEGFRVHHYVPAPPEG